MGLDRLSRSRFGPLQGIEAQETQKQWVRIKVLRVFQGREPVLSTRQGNPWGFSQPNFAGHQPTITKRRGGDSQQEGTLLEPPPRRVNSRTSRVSGREWETARALSSLSRTPRPAHTAPPAHRPRILFSGWSDDLMNFAPYLHNSRTPRRAKTRLPE